MPNLKPDRVTIVDQNSKLLRRRRRRGRGQPGRRRPALGASRTRIRKRIKELVEGVVGPGKARVQVTADLDMSQVTTQEEKYDPDGQVVRSTQTVEENAKENQPDSGRPGQRHGQHPRHARRLDVVEQQPRTAAAPRRPPTTRSPRPPRPPSSSPGTIKKLSIAVAVDGVTTPGEKGKPGAYSPRSAEEMQHIDQLVRSAAGFDATRGDQVSVINVRFDHDAAVGGVTVAAGPRCSTSTRTT